MSKQPGGITAHIDCMIIAGFPGIGKTTTYAAMKAADPLTRVADLDVKDFGTTNGMDVADPAAYVNRIMLMKDSFALIFVSIDPVIRQKMQEARLFYMTVAPEFPPSIAAAMPTYRPDPLVKASFMKRFSDNLGYNTKASTLLDGNGYEDVLESLFQDPMPHIISPVLNKAVVDQAWMQAEQLTRQTINPAQLMGMVNTPRPGMPGMPPIPGVGGMPPFPKK